VEIQKKPTKRGLSLNAEGLVRKT